MRGVSEVRILGLLHIAIMTLYERRGWHQKQFASKVLVGLTHLKGSKVAFDNLGRGADKSEGGFDSHYRYNGTHHEIW